MPIGPIRDVRSSIRLDTHRGDRALFEPDPERLQDPLAGSNILERWTTQGFLGSRRTAVSSIHRYPASAYADLDFWSGGKISATPYI